MKEIFQTRIFYREPIIEIPTSRKTEYSSTISFTQLSLRSLCGRRHRYFFFSISPSIYIPMEAVIKEFCTVSFMDYCRLNFSPNPNRMLFPSPLLQGVFTDYNLPVISINDPALRHSIITQTLWCCLESPHGTSSGILHAVNPLKKNPACIFGEQWK